MIPIYIIFAPKIFNFEIIFAVSIFEFFFASKVFHWVFTFTFHCDMQKQAPILEIQTPDEQVEDVPVFLSNRLLDSGHDGSRYRKSLKLNFGMLLLCSSK